MLTFMLTDVEGSTRLWEQEPAHMAAALARHDVILTSLITTHRGSVIKSRGEGDSFFAVFESGPDAAAAALSIQRALASEPWPLPGPIKVRMALHTGPADIREGDFFGPTVNRAARLRAIAHGGQAVLSEAAVEALGGSLPEGAYLRDLGRHQLRDLSRPEHVFQLGAADLRAEFPPLRSLGSFPNNLPLQLTALLGRRSELEMLSGELKTKRLVTITGPGGVGKTRLAIQAAADTLERFADGSWFIDLAPLTEGPVADQLASTLHVPGGGLASAEEAVIAFLRERQTLLILDNCEHLIEDCALLAARLLSACDALRMVATSREPLNIPGEAVLSLLPLGPTESSGLFVERAHLVRPDWNPDDSEAQAVTRICSRLDGLPLGIELAAARVRHLRAKEIERRLAESFDLLGQGARTADPRHRTLEAAIRWSYELLAADERVAFERLSVFAGSFTLENAEGVLGDELDALDLLTRLADKSLVLADTSTDPARYRLLESLRAFGAEELAARGEIERYRRAHAELFTRLAESAEPDLSGPRQTTALEMLASHLDNLRAALAWCAGADQLLGLRLGNALILFFVARGFLHEGRDWLRQFVHAAGGTVEQRGRALNGVGRLAYGVNDYEEAATAFREALQLGEASGDEVLAARALNNLGTVAEELADYQGARDFYERSLAVIAVRGTPREQSTILNNLGVLEFALGDLEAARRRFEKAVEMKRRGGDLRGISLSLGSLAGVLLELGDLQTARAMCDEALAIDRQNSDRPLMSIDLQVLAVIDIMEGHLDQARSRLAESARLSRELGQRIALIVALETFAEIALAEGDPEKSLRWAAAASASKQAGRGLPEPIYQRRIEATVERSRAELGPARADAAWASGLSMTIEAALDEASPVAPASGGTASPNT